MNLPSDHVESARFAVLMHAIGDGVAEETLLVDHPTYFEEQDIVLNTRTGEHVVVRAIDRQDGMTVTRGALLSIRAPMRARDELLIVGNGWPENNQETSE